MLNRIHEIGSARQPDASIRPAVIDETSLRYPGWRVVMLCFTIAVFSWGFGFYGQGIYLAELPRLRGWSTAMISMASTAYYLLSAVLVAFVGDAIARFGPRRFLLLGIACLGVPTALIGWSATPWQLYADYLLMSFGWAAMGVAAITTLIGLWFDERRGLAISLALTGGSFGGVIGAPLLVTAIDQVGFAATLMIGGALMAAVLVPMTMAWAGQPLRTRAPGMRSGTSHARGGPDRKGWTRGRALRSLAFWTVTAPFAFALLVQVGFLVHQVALLDQRMGRASAGAAVAATAIAAVLGRLGLGFVIDRLDQRLVGALSFLSQAAVLAVLAKAGSPTVLLAACAVFGLSVGNVVALPALIIQREFEATAFAMLVGFSTAIGQFTYAFGPGLLGLLRDVSGGYEAPLLACVALEVAAAGIVMVRGPRTSRHCRFIGCQGGRRGCAATARPGLCARACSS